MGVDAFTGLSVEDGCVTTIRVIVLARPRRLGCVTTGTDSSCCSVVVARKGLEASGEKGAAVASRPLSLARLVSINSLRSLGELFDVIDREPQVLERCRRRFALDSIDGMAFGAATTGSVEIGIDSDTSWLTRS